MEKFKVKVSPNLDGEVPSEGELVRLAEEAGWSDDPGTGRTVLVPDERGAPGYEVFCPIPFAPPVGYEPTPPLDELIKQRVKDEMQRLKDDEELDDIIDAEDFEVEEGDGSAGLETLYEFVAMEDQAPAVKAEPTADDRAKADAEYAELVEKYRAMNRQRQRIEYERRRREEDELHGYSEGKREEGGQ